jgi:hypothetical protein
MKSFRDVLNGRMRTGKGRFVLASQNPPFCSSTESSAPAPGAPSFPKTLRMSLMGADYRSKVCVYLKIKSHVFCGKTFNLPLLPITHVSRLFAFWWLMALYTVIFISPHASLMFLFLVEVSWMLVFQGITGGNMPLFLVFLLLVDLQAIQDRTGITADI